MGYTRNKHANSSWHLLPKESPPLGINNGKTHEKSIKESLRDKPPVSNEIPRREVIRNENWDIEKLKTEIANE